MTDWAKLKVVDLKAELKNRDLPQHGLKADLIARLEEADQETAEKGSQEEVEDVPEDAPATNEFGGDEPSAGEPAVAKPEPQDATNEPEVVDEKPDEDMAETEENKKETDETATPIADEEPSKGVESGDQDKDKEQEVTKNGTSKEASQEAITVVDVPSTGNEVDPQSRDPTVEEKSRTGTVTTTVDSTPSHSLEPTPAAEQQKRKRRSLTPPPTEDSIARKRARTEEIPDQDDNLGSRQEDLLPETANESAPMNIDNEPQTENLKNETSQDLVAPEPEAIAEEHSKENSDKQQDMDYERDVAPALHPATSALYIKNFMRPLRPQDVKSYLIELATHPRDSFDDGIVVEFFLDQIRTHSFAIFKTTAAASRVRTALHDTVWPNESNRKPLWVDFVPTEKVRDWIDTEQANGGSRGRSGARWEVIYDDGPDGVIEAHLEEATSGTGPQPGARPHTGPATATDSIPVGPRALRDPAIPTGPRPVRPGTGPGPRPPPLNPGGASKRTNAHPAIYYQPVSEDLARRRIDNMRSYYTSKRDRDFGREINRYSFENGTSFVDRGKEVFEGIRPPHRERGGMGRERRGGRRRRGGGGGGGRPRSDRYLPPPRDDRRPRRGSVSDDGDTRMRD
ncbi:uncharacterized protein FIESC28_03112 [Fusarium coffeatum]|uniref:SAP domain-containing protein n=1 Tax=Fusarium coffeatum TaxID=231269 RepID=A0A366S3X7_9HYPO|nr:uncharacterized protein FIESC28_03112 [Fusarium coffeatum]RBR23999.1 hypothetical protein FIESC28_03112 [Fusarium coffeatum]